MLGDPWPEEPDEPFKEYREASRPGPPVPEPPEGEASAALQRTFWGLVAVFNIGLFATAFGLMLLWFRAAMIVGGLSFLLGLMSLLYGIHRYRAYQSGELLADAEAEP